MSRNFHNWHHCSSMTTAVASQLRHWVIALQFISSSPSFILICWLTMRIINTDSRPKGASLIQSWYIAYVAAGAALVVVTSDDGYAIKDNKEWCGVAIATINGIARCYRNNNRWGPYNTPPTVWISHGISSVNITCTQSVWSTRSFESQQCEPDIRSINVSKLDFCCLRPW